MLEGIKVVELATHIAAPAAAGVMADWGADVIKIESIQGDPMRWLRSHAPGGCTPVFETNNRGKRSLSLNIASPDGRDIVRRLVGRADVFLTNLRPESLKRAKLDWDSLRADNPGVVYASVTGYGLQGPDANTPAFDNAAYWSRSSMAHLTRPEGQDPFSIRQGSGDHTCALATGLAIMAALLARARTGEGRLVEASLLRTGVFVMGADLSNFLRLGEFTPTRTRDAAANPMNNFFKTAEGRWLFVMPRGSHPDDWIKICEAAGALAATTDARFATSEGRAANGPELVAALDRGFASQSFEEASRRLILADVVWAPLQSPEQVIGDTQAAAAGCFVEVSDGAGGLFRAPAPPVRFDGHDGPPKRPVARLGEHTDAILCELGYALSEIARLRADATVG